MENSSLMARSSAVAGNFPDWSIRTASMSFFVTLNSIQEPRSGMSQHECSFLSEVCVSTEKSTPGERWSCVTMTRSVPFTMNSPPPTMIGISPRYTSSSTGLSFCRRTRTLKGRPYVSFSSRHSSGVYRGLPRSYPRYWSSIVPSYDGIGNTSLRIASSPEDWRCSAGTSSCRNSAYDAVCSSARWGMSYDRFPP